MPTDADTAGTPAAPTTASWGRRIGALFIDWIASLLVSTVIVVVADLQDSGAASWITLGIFWLETALGTAIAGASFGQLLARIRVHRTGGAPLSLFRALLRQLLVCLVIPPLVFREDGRGLHDLWTDAGAYELTPRG